MLGLFVSQLVLVVVRAPRAGEDTIKIGILHSLSGTLAISESVLKDTVKGRLAGVTGCGR